MSEQTRYRLTGALFLLALAAILAPMLFDGDGMPQVEVQPLDASSPRQPVQAPAGAFQEQQFEALEQQVKALREEVDVQGFREADGASFGELALVDPQDSDLVDQTPELGSDPEASSAAELAQVWAVQVASFARSDNAQALRDELRGEGYEGFLSSAKRDGEVWTRVLVGPFLSKSEAQRVSSTIADKFAVAPELRKVVQ